MMLNFKVPVVTIAAGLFFVAGASQSYAQNAGADWSSSYSFPTANDRIARLQTADLAKKAESEYYDSFAPPVTYDYSTTNNTYDQSVGDIRVDAGNGAQVEVSNRTSEGSGTNTYAVGSINTTTNTVSGTRNNIDISAQSSSTGCQDGRVTTSIAATASGADISGQFGGALSRAPGTRC